MTTSLRRPHAHASAGPAGGPWRVHVGDLLGHRGVVRRILRSAPVADLAVVGSRVPSDADLALEASLEAVHGGIVVSGTVAATWAGECSRCLAGVNGTLELEVRELFEHDPVASETYPLDGDEIDLEPVVRDAVLLNLPLAPRCSDHCLGLCPHCGVNRNETPCDCADAEGDPRWAALARLQLSPDDVRDPEEDR